jgi:hypothetical protein
MTTITNDTLFDRTRWVVVRPQKGSYLFYNSRTDELHLIPPTGHAVYAMCDGFRNVGEIATELSDAIDAEPNAVQRHLADFFGALESRGLLERHDA